MLRELACVFDLFDSRSVGPNSKYGSRWNEFVCIRGQIRGQQRSGTKFFCSSENDHFSAQERSFFRSVKA